MTGSINPDLNKTILPIIKIHLSSRRKEVEQREAESTRGIREVRSLRAGLKGVARWKLGQGISSEELLINPNNPAPSE
jgi:hypothetical protein